MADTMAPILDMQNKQDDLKNQDQKINKKASDLSDDARQAKKDEKDFKKSKEEPSKDKSSDQKSSGKSKEDLTNANSFTQLSDDAKESAQEAGSWLQEKGNEIKEVAQTVIEKGKEWLGATGDESQKPTNDDTSRQPGEFKQETGEWINEKYNQVVEKTKDVAQSAIEKGKEWLGEQDDSKLKEKGEEALDKGQEMLDDTKKSSKKDEKSDKSDDKEEKKVLGPLMFKDNTSVIEPPSDNQRSMKENTKELPSVRTAANVGLGRETPQERLQTGKGQFKNDKQADKQAKEQLANAIVGTIDEFSPEATQANEKGKDKQFYADSTTKAEGDIPRGATSKKRAGVEDSAEWQELLNDGRTFTLGDDTPKESSSGDNKNTEDHLQSFISDVDKSQSEYSEERKKHIEMAQDPELTAFERIKAAGMAIADGAMELTEAGRKKIAELYASPSTTVDEDEFKAEKKD